MSATIERTTFAQLRAAAQRDGSTLCEVRKDGTPVLKRPDLSVGSVAGALYVVGNGNAALNVRQYAVADEGSR